MPRSRTFNTALALAGAALGAGALWVLRRLRNLVEPRCTDALSNGVRCTKPAGHEGYHSAPGYGWETEALDQPADLIADDLRREADWAAADSTADWHREIQRHFEMLLGTWIRRAENRRSNKKEWRQ